MSIKGYRELSEEELAMINKIKELGETIEAFEDGIGANDHHADPKWRAIGRTHMQQGLMAWTRAVAKPDSY